MVENTQQLQPLPQPLPIAIFDVMENPEPIAEVT